MKTNWQTKKLGEVCDIKTGKKDVNQGNPSGEYPFFTCAREHTFSDEYSFDTEALLVAGNGDVGHVSYYKGKFEAYQRTYILSNFKEVLPRFLFLYLAGFLKETVSKEKLGNTMPYIKMGMLTEFEIPLPSLTEQKRIVKILDEVFAEIEKAKENAEKNLKNSQELFESYLQGVFVNPGKDWEERIIQEITKVINGYSFDGQDFSSNNKIKSVKITNVGVKEFVEETENYLPEKYRDTLKDYKVKEGNIVIALTRTIISAGLKVAVVPESYDGALLNQRVAAIVPIEKLVDQRFLYNFLCTEIVADYVKAHVNTLMQPNLSINDLKKLVVPCPPLAEQKAIVKKLDALSGETKKLEAIFRRKIADLDELKKSVLKQAFSGEL